MERREYHIIGPPGTGKTRTLSEEAAESARRRGPEAVMIVSLTKAAAVEIGSRVQLPRENVGTMHSICMRGAGLAGKVVLDSTKGFKTWNEWIAKKRPEFRLTGGSDPTDPMAGLGRDPTIGTKNLERFMLLRHRMTPYDLWPASVKEFAFLWSDCLKELDATDFTEMIEAGLDMDAPPGGPQVLYVDEYQDMSKLEGSVVRKWAQEVELCKLAGDADQSIYGWRGADPECFSAHPPGDGNRRVLGQSYRVPIAVHALAQRVIRRISKREENPYLPTSEPGKVRILDDCSWRKPDGWVDDVLRSSEDGGAMVLASCAYLLRPFIDRLRELGCPYWNPYRTNRGDWNPLGSLDSGKRTAASQLLAFLGGEPEGWHVEELKSWLPLLRGAKHKIPLLDDDAYLRYGVKAAIERRQDALGPFLSNREYLDLFQEPETALRAFSRSVEWLRDGMTDEAKGRLAFPLAVFRRGGSERLRQEPKVIVSTIHGVKGGEARHVYVLTALPREWSENGGDELARLFYVAVTRARESCTVICGDRGGYEF